MLNKKEIPENDLIHIIYETNSSKVQEEALNLLKER
jgi:hypothetical protein